MFFSKLEQDFEIVNFVQVWILMKNTAGGQQQECLWEAEIQKLVLPNFFCIFWWGQQKSEASLYILNHGFYERLRRVLCELFELLMLLEMGPPTFQLEQTLTS